MLQEKRCSAGLFLVPSDFQTTSAEVTQDIFSLLRNRSNEAVQMVGCVMDYILTRLETTSMLLGDRRFNFLIQAFLTLQ